MLTAHHPGYCPLTKPTQGLIGFGRWDEPHYDSAIVSTPPTLHFSPVQCKIDHSQGESDDRGRINKGETDAKLRPKEHKILAVFHPPNTIQADHQQLNRQGRPSP